MLVFSKVVIYDLSPFSTDPFNYRIKNEKLNPKNTFILTTDADIDFTPQSADVLLDMLASHAQVGAVCARTHPKGFGVIY